MNRDELLLECFGRDDLKPGKRILEMKEGSDPRGPDVIAHLDLSYKRVIVGNTTLTVAAIANLCTDPAYRGRGYASALVRRAHTEVRDHPIVKYAGVFASDARIFSRLGYCPAGFEDLLVYELDSDEPWPAGRVDVQGGW